MTQNLVSVQIGASWVLVPMEITTTDNVPQSTLRPIPQPKRPIRLTHVEVDDDDFTSVVTNAIKKRIRKSLSVPFPVVSVVNAQKPNANMRSDPSPKDTLNYKEKPYTFPIEKGK